MQHSCNSSAPATASDEKVKGAKELSLAACKQHDHQKTSQYWRNWHHSAKRESQLKERASCILSLWQRSVFLLCASKKVTRMILCSFTEDLRWGKVWGMEGDFIPTSHQKTSTHREGGGGQSPCYLLQCLIHEVPIIINVVSVGDGIFKAHLCIARQVHPLLHALQWGNSACLCHFHRAQTTTAAKVLQMPPCVIRNNTNMVQYTAVTLVMLQ